MRSFGQEGFFPQIERKKKPDQEFRDVFKETKESEDTIMSNVREAVSSYLKKRKSLGRAMPEWVKRGLFAAMLMVPEMAIAEEVEGNRIVDAPVVVDKNTEKTWEEGPRISEETQKAWTEFFESGGQIVVVLSGPEESEKKVYVNAEMLSSGHALAFSFPIRKIMFESFQVINENIIPSLEESAGWHFSTGRNDGSNAFIGSSEPMSSYGCTLLYAESMKMLMESLTIYPQIAFGELGGSASLEPVTTTHNSLFVPQVEPIFYHHGYETAMRIGEIGVYTEAPNRERTDALLRPYLSDIGRGVIDAANLFGFDETIVSRVLVGNTDEVNATANSYTKEIGLFDELLKFSFFDNGIPYYANGIPDEAGRKEIVRQVVSHEVYHLIDHRFGLSSDPTFVSIYAELGKDADYFSEHNQGDGFGGHAKGNPREFIASFLNSLDEPDLVQHVQNMPDSVQLAYLNSLQRLEEILGNNNEVPADAPIHEIVRNHIVELQAIHAN